MNFKELFIDKSKTLIINTDLAMVLGDLNESIVLNQLNYWIEINRKADKHFIEGRYWVYNTYNDWKTNNFPYWSEKTIQRTFTRLENKGIVVSANYNKSAIDKTKWYTIDYEVLEKLVKAYNDGHDKMSPRQDNESYRRDKMSCPEGQNDRAIPEITSETTNRDYIPETTAINAFNSKKELKGNIHAFLSGRKEVGEEKVPYIDLDNCTREELRKHIQLRVKKFMSKHDEYDEDRADDLSKIIEYFYRKYRDVYGVNYTILSDKAFEGIVIKYLYPSLLLNDNEIYGFEEYKKMIDQYFQTDYGQRSGKSTAIDRTLPHFMSDTIRENLAMNTLPLDNLGSAWSL